MVNLKGLGVLAGVSRARRHRFWGEGRRFESLGKRIESIILMGDDSGVTTLNQGFMLPWIFHHCVVLLLGCIGKKGLSSHVRISILEWSMWSYLLRLDVPSPPASSSQNDDTSHLRKNVELLQMQTGPRSDSSVFTAL